MTVEFGPIIEVEATLGLQGPEGPQGLPGDDVDATAAIAAEETARIAADTVLQANIDAETAARTAADTAEATTRANADTALQTNIDAEAAARAAAITTAIDGLVNASPGALDTLNELAAALGDDPNFANTITNTIGAETTARTAADTALQTAIDAKPDLIDEDDFASDSATQAPSQQSVKAYVDGRTGIDVRDIGCTTARTDNQVPINTWMIANEGSGLQLEIPAGLSFTCDAPVSLRSGVGIVGTRNQSELHFNWWNYADGDEAKTGYIQTVATFDGDAASCDDWWMSDFIISGTYSGGPLDLDAWEAANPTLNTTTGMLRPRRTDRIRIERMTLKNSVIGGAFTDINDSIIDDIDIEGMAKGGIQIYGRGHSGITAPDNLDITRIRGENLGDDLVGIHSDLSTDTGDNGSTITVSTTTDSTTVTSTGFTTAMVGQVIDIRSAGPYGSPHNSVIESVVDGVSAVIKHPTPSAVTAGECRVDHQLPSRIRIDGVSLRTSGQYTAARAVGIDGLRDSHIRNVTSEGTAGAAVYVSGARPYLDTVWPRRLDIDATAHNIGELAGGATSTRPNGIFIFGLADSSIRLKSRDTLGSSLDILGGVNLKIDIDVDNNVYVRTSTSTAPTGGTGAIEVTGTRRGGTFNDFGTPDVNDFTNNALIHKAQAKVTSGAILRNGSINIASVTVANTNEYTVTLTGTTITIDDPIIVAPNVGAARSVVADYVNATTILVKTFNSGGGASTSGFSLLIP